MVTWNLTIFVYNLSRHYRVSHDCCWYIIIIILTIIIIIIIIVIYVYTEHADRNTHGDTLLTSYLYDAFVVYFMLYFILYCIYIYTFPYMFPLRVPPYPIYI